MERIIDGKSHVTTAAAAEQLETTITRVLMLLRENALEGVQIDNEWYVESASIACCKTHGKDVKTAKGCASHCTSGGCGCK